VPVHAVEEIPSWLGGKAFRLCKPTIELRENFTLGVLPLPNFNRSHILAETRILAKQNEANPSRRRKNRQLLRPKVRARSKEFGKIPVRRRKTADSGGPKRPMPNSVTRSPNARFGLALFLFLLPQVQRGIASAITKKYLRVEIGGEGWDEGALSAVRPLTLPSPQICTRRCQARCFAR
jgi:hypothetical protein